LISVTILRHGTVHFGASSRPESGSAKRPSARSAHLLGEPQPQGWKRLARGRRSGTPVLWIDDTPSRRITRCDRRAFTASWLRRRTKRCMN